MLKKLQPDYYFESAYEITPEFLKSIGIDLVIFDIDNTLEPYATPKPTEKTLNLFKTLNNADIKIAVASNNNDKRVSEFCSELGIFYISDAKKPLRGCLAPILNHYGIDKENTALIGDQVFTDIWAARNNGVKAILVKQLTNIENVFCKFKRLFEKPIIRSYLKEKGKNL